VAGPDTKSARFWQFLTSFTSIIPKIANLSSDKIGKFMDFYRIESALPILQFASGADVVHIKYIRLAAQLVNSLQTPGFDICKTITLFQIRYQTITICFHPSFFT
jgi:hypothetical protein